jgi:hypothetical protein
MIPSHPGPAGSTAAPPDADRPPAPPRPTVPPPAPPKPPSRFAGARRAVREFAVILAGVLAALGAQAWWEGRSDRTLERDYLGQLLADTRENEARLETAIAEDSVSGHAGERLLAIMGAGGAAPADSVRYWLTRIGSSSDFKPVTGTHRALMGTGDLRLVRTDTLRSLITAYAATLDSEAERLEQLRAMVLNAVGTGARSRRVRRIFTGSLAPGDVDVASYRDDDDVAGLVMTLQAANYNRLAGLRRLRDASVRLRTALEHEAPTR